MEPVRHILNRIRWDGEFGTGHFEIGYLDHMEHGVIRVPFQMIHFEEGNTFSLHVESESGEMLMIPFHRIREVVKDGHVIWSRPSFKDSDAQGRE